MRFLALILVTCLAACSTFVKTDVPPTDLQRDIRAGEVLAAGDRIRVTTLAGDTVELTVTSVDETTIHGEKQSVPIDDIATLEIRRLNKERTVAVTAGSMLLTWWIIGLIVSAIVVFPA